MLKNQTVPDYVIFDLETTGISCTEDQIIEIAAVKVVDHKIIDEFSTLVNPQCPIPPAASQVNGITDDMVADAPLLKPALSDFLAFAGDFVLAGHNIHSFDLKFIYRDCKTCFGSVPTNDYIDTLTLARLLLPQLSHHRLTDLASYYKYSTDGAHRALNDCRMNQFVYEQLAKALPAAQKQNQFKSCPKCGQPLVKRNGKFGEFWGCSGFPDCRYTKNI